jgi:hypothetical protein
MENITWFQNRLTCARQYRIQSSRLCILTHSLEWSITVNNSHILKKTLYARIKRSVHWPKSKLAARRRSGVCSLVRFSTHIEPTNCSEALGNAMVKVEWDCFPCARVALPPLPRVMAGWLLPPSSDCNACCFHVVSRIHSFCYIVRTIPNLTAKLLATRPKVLANDKSIISSRHKTASYQQGNERKLSSSKQFIDIHTIDMLLEHKRIYSWEGKTIFLYYFSPHENVI